MTRRVTGEEKAATCLREFYPSFILFYLYIIYIDIGDKLKIKKSIKIIIVCKYYEIKLN